MCLQTTLGSWTAIVDASIKWGGKKLIVVLRVPTYIMNDRSKALQLKDVEVVGLFVKDVVNGEVISDLLQSLFSQLGAPLQILTDGGSDLAKGIRLLSETSIFNGFQSLDIGHFAANLLKKKYFNNSQFQKFLSFVSNIGAKLRQTIAAWIAPNKLRVKGKFQGISDFAKWALKAFEYCEKHLSDCDDKTNELIKKNFQGYQFLLSFAQQFYQDSQVLNQLLQLIKNNGLSKNTMNQGLGILAQLSNKSLIRQEMEDYLRIHLELFQQHQIPNALLSTDIIECLFGKIKYLIEHSPTKDFNKLTLLLPALVGTLTEENILAAQKNIKIKDIQQWEIQNIGDTILKKKEESLKN
jgi:hypothetical protein